MQNKLIKYGGAIVLLLLFLSIVGYHCPIQKITGFPCPGCNMTTSAYWLFVKKDVSTSFYFHAMLIPTIIVFILALLLTKYNKTRIRDGLLIVWGILMIIYYIYRMLNLFPNAPMVYDNKSVFSVLFNLYR